MTNSSQNASEHTNFVPTCVTPVPPMEKSDIISTTNLGQLIIHDITHHYHNHFLCHAITKQHCSHSLHYNYPLEIDTSVVQSSVASPNLLSPNNSTTMNNSAPHLPSLNNLGFILAQYGYVPRATFRPTMSQEHNKNLSKFPDSAQQTGKLSIQVHYKLLFDLL